MRKKTQPTLRPNPKRDRKLLESETQPNSKPLKRVKRDQDTEDEEDTEREIRKIILPKIETQVNILTDLKRHFESNVVPNKVRSRETEKAKLLKFMRENLRQEIDSKPTLIITGQPGIGKTMLLNNMVECFKDKKICEMSCVCHEILRRSRIKIEKLKTDKELLFAFRDILKGVCVCSDSCSMASICDSKIKRSRKKKLKDKSDKARFEKFLKGEVEFTQNTKQKNMSNKRKSESNQIKAQEQKDFEKAKREKLKHLKNKKKRAKKLSPIQELKRISKEVKLTPKSSHIARQDLTFEFVFLNTTAYLDSIKFLKAIGAELKLRFTTAQQRKLQQKLKHFENNLITESDDEIDTLKRDRMSVNNGCMVLNHLKNILNFFSDRLFFVIIIDELDSLLKKDKKNFEFVVEFLNSEISNAVKIGVSNTFGISSQVFDYTVYAEISRLIFPQYSESDLVSIIKQRLRLALGPDRKGFKIVNDACLAFLAKKLMKNSWGDIRLLLKLFQQVLALKIRSLNNMKVIFFLILYFIRNIESYFFFIKYLQTFLN